MFKLTVVICTHNRSDLLIKCLKSLETQTVKDFETIIVDNNSTDSTKEVSMIFCHGDPSKRAYYFESSVGLSHARNTGYKNAQGEYVAYIDDDAYATPNWCELILKNIDEFHFDVCGGKILPYYEHKRPFWFDDRLEIRNYGKKNFVPKNKIRYAFPGSNIIIKKAHIYAFGGFNPDLGMKGNKIGLGEETSLCLKISEQNDKFYHDSDLFVYHFTPKRNTTLNYRVKRYYAAGASAVIYQNNALYQIFKKLTSFSAFCFFLLLALISFNSYFFVYSLQQISYKIGFIVTLLKLKCKRGVEL
jgi:glycosyltransferase involved in cell wall biosynthesis